MELDFKPGKFALNRDTLETVIVKEVKDDDILIVDMVGSLEKWDSKKNYNLFKRKNNKWIVEGPPIIVTDKEVDRLSNTNRTNISERFK
jgi:nucleoside-triphosphatase THEP1